MAIPNVNAEAIRRALAEFDQVVRSSADWVSWEDNKAQAWVLLVDEKRYPPKKIVSMATGIPVSSFSGGPETNDYLAERGFQVIRLREESLTETFRLILQRYRLARQQLQFGGHHEIKELFTQIRKLFSVSRPVKAHPHVHVAASYGKGNWATIPWISFLDDRETRSTQSGTYVVYLFKEDGQGCYLKLAQGVTEAEKAYGAKAPDILGEQAAVIRERLRRLADLGFDLSGKTSLATTQKLGKLYEASTVASKYYSVEAIPNDEALLADLEHLLTAYDEYVRETKGATAKAVDDGRQLALIGPSQSIAGELERISQFIKSRGAWSSWWSFAIKEEARHRLKPPFSLYIYAGKGKICARLRVDEFVAARGSDGQVSPWPEQTFDEWQGVNRFGPRQSEICKTWFKVGGIEVFPAPKSAEDFEIAVGLSTPESLINQNSFGYVIESEPETSVNSSKPISAEPQPATSRPPPLPLGWLEDRTGIARKELESMVEAITGPCPQIILAGPPGTSKTWVARQLALFLTRNRPHQIRFVQFHQSYSYESFIEGLRPVAKGAAVGFELRPGVVRDVVDSMRKDNALDSSEDHYVIVIDEANRANLPRVLGELMFLFEYRGEIAHLQYSGPFSLPRNLSFIATMNTADRSIRAIDIALRRRFDVFELGPDAEILAKYHAHREDLEVLDLVDGFLALNEALVKTLDRHHTIGHAFFMQPQMTPSRLKGIWTRKVFPLIEEFFFDQPELAAEFSCERFWPSADVAGRI
jgi:5-methylcytosine-specific restriction protein B